MTSLSTHFMATDVSETGVLGHGDFLVLLSVLGHGDYGGLLEKCWYYILRQGEVENVSEDTCQMVSACSEYMSDIPSGPASL